MVQEAAPGSPNAPSGWTSCNDGGDGRGEDAAEDNHEHDRVGGCLFRRGLLGKRGDLAESETGVHGDRDAVIADFTLRGNSGVVEGHVDRIKMLKRRMFGRTGFELLRKRALPAR
jgi:hypothetical protein